MSKTTLWNEVNTQVAEWAKTNKLSEAKTQGLIDILEVLLAPKSSGGVSQNPPKVVDGVTHYFCRFHQSYYPEDKMVMANGKSKGYCKAAIAKWNKTNSQIKKLNGQASEAILNGDLEGAKVFSEQAKELGDKFNSPSFYNAEEDWANFKK